MNLREALSQEGWWILATLGMTSLVTGTTLLILASIHDFLSADIGFGLLNLGPGLALTVAIYIAVNRLSEVFGDGSEEPPYAHGTSEDSP